MLLTSINYCIVLIQVANSTPHFEGAYHPFLATCFVTTSPSISLFITCAKGYMKKLYRLQTFTYLHYPVECLYHAYYAHSCEEPDSST